jgi:bifunctional DNA-binding transcriptional regulator/antitoxin component of YhaV-PrlF toxin-antitoxin module
VPVPLLIMKEVKKRRRGFTRISAKHQATIPVQALKEAGLKPGDEVRVVAAGRGRLVLERDINLVQRHAGALRGVYEPGELDRLRDEWR